EKDSGKRISGDPYLPLGRLFRDVSALAKAGIRGPVESQPRAIRHVPCTIVRYAFIMWLLCVQCVRGICPNDNVDARRGDVVRMENSARDRTLCQSSILTRPASGLVGSSAICGSSTSIEIPPSAGFKISGGI